MKRILTLLLCVGISSAAAFAQTAPAIQWQRSLGGTNRDYATAAQQTCDGGYVILGNAQSADGDVTSNQGNNDYWIVKLSSAGYLQWQSVLGGTDNDIAETIQQTSDGGYVIAGSTQSADGDVTGHHGYADYWVIKLDSAGMLQWQKTFGGPDQDEATAIQQTTDGGYIVAGKTRSTTGDVTGHHGDYDYWIVKLDDTGALQWQRTLGGTDSDIAYFIRQTSDDGYIIAGTSASVDGDVTGHHGDYDYWIVKLDDAGALQWQKALGGSGNEGATAIQQTTDGGYIVAGRSASTDGDVAGNHHGSHDFWIVKLTRTGVLQWQKLLGGSSHDEASAVQQTQDGGYIVAGHSLSDDGDVTGSQGYADFWVVKLDSTGILQWQKALGGTHEEYLYSIQQTSDGGYIVAGSSQSNDGDVTGNHGLVDYWVVKLAADPAAVSSTAFIIPYVYPNPAMNQLSVEVGNQTAGALIGLYDLQGRLLLEKEGTGTAVRAEFNTAQLASGSYFLRIKADGVQQIKKVQIAH